MVKKLFILLCLCSIGIGSAWGETATYTQGDTNKAGLSSGVEPKGVTVTFSTTYSNKNQLTSGYNMTLTLTGYAGKKITGVSLSMKSNTSAGAGYLSVKAGSSTLASIGSSSSGVKFNDSQWYGAWSTSYVDVDIALSNNDYTIQNGESIVINIGATTNSLYCQSFTLTYEDADNRTPVNMTGFTAASSTLIKGNTTGTSVTNDQAGWTASYTYSSNNEDVATVSADGTITAVSKGTATITATLNVDKGDPTYKAGTTKSKSIDIKVNNPSHIASFSINGIVDTSKDQIVEEGESVTFPANPTVDDVDFIGWVKEAIIGTQDDKPTLVNTSTEKMGEANATYYAVFATAEVGNEYTQITSTSALEAGGRYLIVGYSSPTYKALPVDKAETLTAVSPSSSKITNPADELGWTLEGTAGKWKIKSVSNGKYIQISGGNLTFETSTELTWNASVSSNKFTWTSSATSGNKILSYYANGNKFNAYTSANTVYMYKANVTYSDYCTTVVPLVKHTLTISEVANGTLTVKKGNTILTSGKQVAEGAVITLTATPAAHYHFNAWTGNVEVSEDEGVYTFTMPTTDATIGVTFAEDAKYHITANVPEGGTYTVKVGDAVPVTIEGENDGFDVYEGVTITMTSTADDAHKVHSTPFIVEYNDGTEIKKSSFYMPTQAVTITAQFVNTYSITAGTCENGSVSKIADKDGNAITRNSSGSKVVVSATPNEHYHLTGMYYVKDGEDKHNAITATDNEYSFSMVASNITVYAEFEEDENVSITWSVNGKTDVLPASKTYVGEAIVFPTGLADVSGKKFMGWVSEAYSNATTAPTYANATTVTATENATYYAVLADCEGTSTDYSYTITTSTSPYNVNGYKNGEQTITATCPTDNSKTFVVTYQIANFGEVSGKLQMKKEGDGYMYNKTDLGSITSVTIESGSNLTTYYGTLENPKSGTEVGTGKGYFRIVAGSSAGTCSSITVAFTKGNYTYSNYTTSIKSKVSMSITSAKWSTFIAPFDVTIPEDVNAYTVEATEDALEYTPVETTIPACTPVVLYKDVTTTFAQDFYGVDNATERTFHEGSLVGTLDAIAKGEVPTTVAGAPVYLLQKQSGKVAFFKTSEGSEYSLNANRAYLVGASAINAKAYYEFDDNEPTGINELRGEQLNASKEGIFDLSGRKLSAPQKGINIINGVKVIVK